MTDFRKKTSDSPHSVPGVKDDNGAYVPTPKTVKPPLSLDRILEDQLTVLNEVTLQLLGKSKLSNFNKDDIASLATCIKVTMDLKAKEKELLDTLTDEELEKAASAD